MNNLSFLTSILRYSLIHPTVGMQLLQSKYQTWCDSRNKDSIFNYGSKKNELDEILQRLFPNSEYSVSDLQKNVNDLQNHARDFFNKLQGDVYPSRRKPYPIEYTLDNTSGFFLYVLCKLLKPEKIVETGVAYGSSSMYILQAINENKKGMLYSIDYAFTPWQSKEMIGAAIPDQLRKNWKLVFGPSSQELKKLLTSLDEVDVFFHDSLHTSKNMAFEFETAWLCIKKGGYLISDDISGNNAFYKFYSKLNIEPFILPQKSNNSYLGIIQKS
ncbi:MAG TPA: class I SAM-dependent methyltransferase [Candidatus Nitrosotalea sp.]|nr:class I SAM-dependent methyltransferase [Candidatus Nitrosotalea sp.]